MTREQAVQDRCARPHPWQRPARPSRAGIRGQPRVLRMRGAVGRARLRQVLQGFEAVPGIVQGAGQGAPGPRVGRDSGVVVPRWYRKGTGQGLAALGGDLAVGDEAGQALAAYQQAAVSSRPSSPPPWSP